MTVWTEDMEERLRSGIKSKKKSAQMIADELGVSRNSVLGKIFRLGLSLTRQPHEPKARKTSSKTSSKSSSGPRGRKRLLGPDNFEEFRDMRDVGLTFKEIAENFECSMATVYQWAIQNGLHLPQEARYFSPEDVQYICENYPAPKNVPIEDMADHLHRSFGVVRQKVLALQRAGILTQKRDPSKTRLIKRYGESAVIAGKTGKEAIATMRELKALAIGKARLAATEAKMTLKNQALEQMRSDIAAGMDRNQAIFNCRAKGVSLDELGAEFDITRERIRQICNKYAENLALQELVERLERDNGGLSGSK